LSIFEKITKTKESYRLLKFPLRKKILIITEIGNIICEIKYAGKNTLKLKDVVKEMYTDNGEYFFSEMKDDMIIDREKVIGYSTIVPIKKKEENNNTNIVNFTDYKRK